MQYITHILCTYPSQRIQPQLVQNAGPRSCSSIGFYTVVVTDYLPLEA